MTAEPNHLKANRNKLVYYDTNVWIAHLQGYNEPIFKEECDALFNDMLEGRVKVVASNHILSETLHTLRKKVVEDAPEGAGRDECNRLVDEKTKEFTTLVDKWKMQQQILIVPTSKADATLKEHYKYVWDKMHSIPFDSLTSYECPECEQYLPKDYDGECTTCSKNVKSRLAYKYSGVGYPDLDHAYMALQHDASAIYTHDKAFKNLWDDPEFKDINIYVFSKSRGWTLS